MKVVVEVMPANVLGILLCAESVRSKRVWEGKRTQPKAHNRLCLIRGLEEIEVGFIAAIRSLSSKSWLVRFFGLELFVGIGKWYYGSSLVTREEVTLDF